MRENIEKAGRFSGEKIMEGKPNDAGQQSFLFQDLKSMLDARHPLYRLAAHMPWKEFEDRFGPLYSREGRPGISIRVMVSLVMLKHLYDQSDERLIERWIENAYWQFFSGMEHFQWKPPCDPCELVRFRQRIGPDGCEFILKVSARLHGGDQGGSAVTIDTTVQEKNIAHPTDSRLYQRVTEQCVTIAKREGIALRRSYRRTIRRLRLELRTRNFPKAKRKARKATKKLRVIAGRLLRDVRRKCSKAQLLAYAESFALFEKVLTQEVGGPDHIYSLHEPDVYCLAKGKDHKLYEFGSKVSVAVDAESGIIVGAFNCTTNRYDGHTVPDALEQIEHITGWKPGALLADRGYRGVEPVGRTRLITPDTARRLPDGIDRDEQRRLLRRRTAIEPVIGHLKSDHRLCRNFLKGWIGDEINVLLAAVGWNLSKWLRKIFALRAWCILWLLRVKSVSTSEPQFVTIRVR
jgi:IS5 family transposase